MSVTQVIPRQFCFPCCGCEWQLNIMCGGRKREILFRFRAFMCLTAAIKKQPHLQIPKLKHKHPVFTHILRGWDESDYLKLWHPMKIKGVVVYYLSEIDFSSACPCLPLWNCSLPALVNFNPLDKGNTKNDNNKSSFAHEMLLSLTERNISEWMPSIKIKLCSLFMILLIQTFLLK